ncbi:hypothetical protein HDU67_008323 [Dinochytrium kinnereticum]|nr:hypothetical protein HDU67_008323 [Dinochytrium kinnereticum]
MTLSQTEDNNIYYFNFVSGESIWDHPCDEHYKKLYEREKLKSSGLLKSSDNQVESTIKEDPKSNKEENLKSLKPLKEREGHSLAPLKGPSGKLSGQNSLTGSLPKLEEDHRSGFEKNSLLEKPSVFGSVKPPLGRPSDPDSEDIDSPIDEDDAENDEDDDDDNLQDEEDAKLSSSSPSHKLPLKTLKSERTHNFFRGEEISEKESPLSEDDFLPPRIGERENIQPKSATEKSDITSERNGNNSEIIASKLDQTSKVIDETEGSDDGSFGFQKSNTMLQDSQIAKLGPFKSLPKDGGALTTDSQSSGQKEGEGRKLGSLNTLLKDNGAANTGSLEKVDDTWFEREKMSIMALYKEKLAKLEEQEREVFALKEAAVKKASEDQKQEDEKYKEKLNLTKERYSQMISREEELQKSRFEERMDALRESYDDQFEEEKQKLEDKLESMREEHRQLIKSYEESLKSTEDEKKQDIEKIALSKINALKETTENKITEERRLQSELLDKERAEFQTYTRNVLEEAKSKMKEEHEQELVDLKKQLLHEKDLAIEQERTIIVMNEMKRIDALEEELERRRKSLEDLKSQLIFEERQIENRRSSIEDEKITLMELERDISMSIDEQRRVRLSPTRPIISTPVNYTGSDSYKTVNESTNDSGHCVQKETSKLSSKSVEMNQGSSLNEDLDSDHGSENVSSSPTWRLRRQFKREERLIEKARQFIKKQRDNFSEYPYEGLQPPSPITPKEAFTSREAHPVLFSQAHHYSHDPLHDSGRMNEPEGRCFTNSSHSFKAQPDSSSAYIADFSTKTNHHYTPMLPTSPRMYGLPEAIPKMPSRNSAPKFYLPDAKYSGRNERIAPTKDYRSGKSDAFLAEHIAWLQNYRTLYGNY